MSFADKAKMNYSKLIDACICIEDIEAIFKQSVASCDKCNFLLVWIQFAHYINHKTCQPIVTNQVLLEFLVSLQQQITRLIIAKTTREIGLQAQQEDGFPHDFVFHVLSALDVFDSENTIIKSCQISKIKSFVAEDLCWNTCPVVNHILFLLNHIDQINEQCPIKYRYTSDFSSSSLCATLSLLDNSSATVENVFLRNILC
jgi:hypothetical protein